MYEDDEESNQPGKCRRIFNSMMIEPSNRKVQWFSVAVSIMFYFDFVMTCQIVGHYRFITGEVEQFFDYKYNYFFICMV